MTKCVISVLSSPTNRPMRKWSFYLPLAQESTVLHGVNLHHRSSVYIPTYLYLTCKDASSAQVSFNMEFVMKRAKLQYAIKPQQWVTKLYKINKNMTNYKEKIIKTQ